MTIHEYLTKAVQDDAQRRGERDRLLLLEARRARAARRQHAGHTAPAVRLARLLFRRAPHKTLGALRWTSAGSRDRVQGARVANEVPVDDEAGAMQTSLPPVPNQAI
jgi:hypothetical protein